MTKAFENNETLLAISEHLDVLMVLNVAAAAKLASELPRGLE